MTAYYNEIDPKAAAWLRELIKRGLIADGTVDERDIRDIAPTELMGFTQCHFFAGIGVWSYALRRAGWSDDRPVWTGSCPCQPFSAAGKGNGFDDERHLWPAFFWLIEQCRPAIVFGEQVASKDAEPWIDLVQDDLEAVGYGLGAVPFPSAGVGAPHIRDRLYWVAESADQRHERARAARGWRDGPADLSSTRVVADADIARPQGRGERGNGALERAAGPGGVAGRLAEPERVGLSEQQRNAGAMGCATGRSEGCKPKAGRSAQEAGRSSEGGNPGPTNGLWRDADWLLCRDGKWRPVEPGTFPLAHGAAARVGRLRGYGNAINAEAATAFIEAHLGG